MQHDPRPPEPLPDPPTEPKKAPRYRINPEAFAQHPNPGPVVDHLVDCLAKPDWKRPCGGCLKWNSETDGLDKYPHRPGAVAPHVSCNGCWYSYLDDIKQQKEWAIREARRRARKLRGRSRPVRRRRRRLVASRTRPVRRRERKTS